MKRPKSKLVIAVSLLAFQGCASTQVHLDDQLDVATVKALASQQKCELPFIIQLDEPSSNLVITQYPDGLTAKASPQTFPIGKTLAAYIEQAQFGAVEETVLLTLELSEFFYTFIFEHFRTKVDQVKYHAKFIGPDLLGTIEISESYFLPLVSVYWTPPKYYAVSKALRNTTVELFAEVHERVCDLNSTSLKGNHD